MKQPRRQQGSSSLAGLEQLLGHTFQDASLLELAVTHRSLASDSGDADRTRNNERLEFLGDAALGLLVAESLFARFPKATEGDMTRMRVSVITRKHLAEVGQRLGIGKWLRLGQTAVENDGRGSANILSDTMEALIAALYLDGGPATARQFVEREVLGPALPGMIDSISADAPRSFKGAAGDFKTELQEWLRAQGRGQPEYRLLSTSGPDHRRTFQVEVAIVGEPATGPLAQAEGSSKKEAQQQAARQALGFLREQPVFQALSA